MVKVKIYTSRLCGFCVAAKRLLDQKDVVYEEISVDNEPTKRQEAMTLSGQRTVPQIWIGDLHVGGFTDLAGLEQQGKLDALLKQQ